MNLLRKLALATVLLAIPSPSLFAVEGLADYFVSEGQMLIGVVATNVSGPPVICGTDANGNLGDQSTCGQRANAYAGYYPGDVRPDESSWTLLNSCIGQLAASTNYYMTADVGTDQTVTCVTLWSGQTIDMRGHTMKGMINSGGTVDSTIIMNGTVLCNHSDSATPYGCIYGYNDHQLTGQFLLHDLIVTNAVDPGAGQSEAVHLESPGTNGTKGFKVDHVTIAVQTGAGASRTIGIDVVSQDILLIENSALSCTTNANACNPIQIISGATSSTSKQVINNEFPLNASGMAETARAVTWDNGDVAAASGPTNFSINNNYCIANVNRCFRTRQTSGSTVQYNYIAHCQDTAAGCYHLADSGVNPAVSNYNLAISHETIQMDGSGTAFYVRSGQGITVKDITISGTSGRLGYVTYSAGDAVTSDVTFCRDVNSGSLGTSSTVDANGTVHIFQDGNWSGGGTVDNLGNCS